MSFDPGVYDPQVFGAAEAESCLFDGAIFDAGVFDVCVDGEPEPQPEVSPEVPRLRTYRRYRLIEDPDKLLEEFKQQEKTVEKEKKKLKVLIKKSALPNISGVLYQATQERIQALEARIDDRLERIAELAILIQMKLDEDDEDDEELLFL